MAPFSFPAHPPATSEPVHAEAIPMALPPCSGLTAAPLPPCTIVIFGASGDLATRKLLPALFRLFLHNGLPDRVAIVGCGRTQWDDLTFRERLAEAVRPDSREQWRAFSRCLHYWPINYDSASAFAGLAMVLGRIDRHHQTGGNHLFYLAVPPSLYATITARLGLAGLAGLAPSRGSMPPGWPRIVVEKPFGRDLASAMELDQTLHLHFTERQIFRIDHYLAKETVQNVLMLRFANTIFEPVWNRNYVDYVGIVAAEELGVEHRADFYEQTGVLRDMFQNHMLQLLALTAMEPPSRFEAERLRDETVKVFRSLKPFDRANVAANLVLGQYGPGGVRGRAVAGYLGEPGVSPSSRVPTFAMLRVFIDNWRWRQVPFYLVSGKRLARKETAIIVQFKEVPHAMFPQLAGGRIGANRLTLGIAPDEEIRLTFQTKTPGPRVCLRPVTMDFKYRQNLAPPMVGAYEKAILDCLAGEQALFWRQDGVEQCWQFLSPILDQCEVCGTETATPQPYAAGSWGPEAVRPLMRMLVGEADREP